MIIYFAISGAWQVFRFNDLPKNEPPSAMRTLLHELSKPHTSSTLPSLSPKTDRSALFNWMAVAMGLGMVTTALIGIVLGIRFGKSRRLVLFCLVAGVLIPIGMLFLRV